MEKDKPLKKRIFDIIQIGSVGDLPSKAFDIIIAAVIIVNVLAMFLETFDELGFLKPVFDVVEAVAIAVFCIEYILRIWTADLLYPDETRGKAILKYICSFEGIIQLGTIMPFYYFSGFAVFRMLRVVRIFHLFRINANSDSFEVITSVLYEKKNQLMSSVFIIIVLMFGASICMYSAEHDAQPEVFRNAFSGIWYSVSTILTIGYGDLSPVTITGRIMGILLGFLGVGLVAIPTGIISAGFVEQYTQFQNSTTTLDDINLRSIVVDIDSRFLGKTAEEVGAEYGVVIVMAKRRDITIIPNDDYHVALEDVLIIYNK